jgi:hypothetical protein
LSAKINYYRYFQKVVSEINHFRTRFAASPMCLGIPDQFAVRSASLRNSFECVFTVASFKRYDGEFHLDASLTATV